MVPEGWHFLAPIDAGRITASTRLYGDDNFEDGTFNVSYLTGVVGIMAIVAGFSSHSGDGTLHHCMARRWELRPLPFTGLELGFVNWLTASWEIIAGFPLTLVLVLKPARRSPFRPPNGPIRRLNLAVAASFPWCVLFLTRRRGSANSHRGGFVVRVLVSLVQPSAVGRFPRPHQAFRWC